MDEIPKKPYTKWFDYDKMKKGFEIRTRKAGDYIIVAVSYTHLDVYKRQVYHITR